jgi:hypothetical protein
MIKWSEIFQLIVMHVIRHGNGQVLKPSLCVAVQHLETAGQESMLFTHTPHSTPHEYTRIQHQTSVVLVLVML